MTKPPKKAVKEIKEYCEITQCRRCIYGFEKAPGFVGCLLTVNPPCDWKALQKGVRYG